MQAPIIQSINVCVPLSMPEFKRLMKLDFLDVVQPRLVYSGARDIEYEGHYGPNVFLTCDQPDLPNIVKALAELTAPKKRVSTPKN